METQQRKKKYLVNTCMHVLSILFVFGFISIIFIFAGRYSLWLCYTLAGLLAIMYVFLYASMYIHLCKPYRELVRLQKLFLNEEIYDEYLDAEVAFSSEMLQVNTLFQHLLKKQNIIQLSKKQAEYLALQNQINPHFLYNTLEAIRGDALDIGAKDIANTTEALATFFRYTISEMSDLVSVEEELVSVDNYFKIQRYRFGDKLRLRIIAEDDDVYCCQLPKLTLQPIIENAIFHGLETKPGGGTITILMQLTEKRVIIHINDNGVGMSPENTLLINDKLEKIKVSYIQEDSSSSIGIALRNVAQRIKLLFGEEYGLRLYSTQGIGTEVVVTIPRIAKEDGELLHEI